MPEPATSPRHVRVALIGNPNVGKTSLFNHLTGLRQKVANYPGVTVERREGRVAGLPGPEIGVLDLPGVNSLVARSPDEKVAADVLLGRQDGVERPDAVVVVVDAARPRRGLFLLGQVLETGLPALVCLNMVDEARREGVAPNAAALSDALGLPVVETVASRKAGVDTLREALADGRFSRPSAHALVELPGVQGLPEPSPERWGRLREVVASAGLADQEAAARHRQASVLLGDTADARRAAQRERSDRIDRVLLSPVLGPLVFILVMGTVFQAVFALADAPIEWIESGFDALGSSVSGALSGGFFEDFLVNGVLAGVGGVVVFLPQILILFLFIGLLEDSGYMTRAAFLVDRPLRAIGLSGRAFIPLLSSFACAIPGIMAARAIEDRRERLITLMVAPLMTCSARLPVYAILIGAFVPEQTVLGFLGVQGLVLLGLYLFGMVIAAFAALVMSRMLERSGVGPGILEMAPYRWPSLKSVGIRLWQRGSMFIRRAGTVILAMSIVVWVLMTFPQTDREPGMDDATYAAHQQANTFAGRLGHIIEPVIEPLGYDWKIGIGLVGSLAAREVFVSTMSVVYAVEQTDDATDEDARVADAMGRARWGSSDRPVYDLATVLSLLVFYAIALQCLSTVAVVYRETGSWLWTAGQFLALTALAWVAAFVTHLVAS